MLGYDSPQGSSIFGNKPLSDNKVLAGTIEVQPETKTTSITNNVVEIKTEELVVEDSMIVLGLNKSKKLEDLDIGGIAIEHWEHNQITGAKTYDMLIREPNTDSFHLIKKETLPAIGEINSTPHMDLHVKDLNATNVNTENYNCVNCVISGDLTVNGTTTTINTVNLEVKDNLVVLNKGGAWGSAGSSGICIEEGGIITASIKLSDDRAQWYFTVPDQNDGFAYKLNQSVATDSSPTFDKLYVNTLSVTNKILDQDIPDLKASKITSETFHIDRIPVLTSERIPTLDAGKITSGTFNVDRIPNLDASKITAGTMSVDRISGLVPGKIYTNPPENFYAVSNSAWLNSASTGDTGGNFTKVQKKYITWQEAAGNKWSGIATATIKDRNNNERYVSMQNVGVNNIHLFTVSTETEGVKYDKLLELSKSEAYFTPPVVCNDLTISGIFSHTGRTQKSIYKVNLVANSKDIKESGGDFNYDNASVIMISSAIGYNQIGFYFPTMPTVGMEITVINNNGLSDNVGYVTCVPSYTLPNGTTSNNFGTSGTKSVSTFMWSGSYWFLMNRIVNEGQQNLA